MTAPKETAESRKRPRPEEAKDHDVSTKEEKPTPAYGSKEYWEKRYESTNGEQAEEDPEPYHAWYFQFDDLAPILLPLIIGSADYDDEDEGGGDDDDDENKSDSEAEKGDECNDNSQIDKRNKKGLDSTTETLPQKIDNPKSNEDESKNAENAETDEAKEQTKNPDGEEINANNDNEEEGSDAEEFEEVEGFEVVEMEEDDQDETSEMVRPGLAKNGPISVLEVGCGDAPLGNDLAVSVQEHASKNAKNPCDVVQKIVCLDYSKNVIQTMKQEQEQQQSDQNNKPKGVPVVYEVGDARDLSYKDESFHVILEKGTLDAMLSDSDQGKSNCRSIVSECARVLTIGGYLVIISHLNAHVESGLEWLNSVIVPGLRAAGNNKNKFEWLIEVHGSDVEIPDDDEDGNQKEIESPGPAVYLIEKVGLLANKQQEGEANEDGSKEELQPTIPLKFFSY